MGLLNLDDTIETVSDSAKEQSRLPLDVLLVSSVLAGAYIAFSAFVAMFASVGNPWPEAVPGMQKLLYAILYPLGKVFVIVAGAHLFTGNCMSFTVAYLKHEVKGRDLVKNLAWVWIGNFAGGVLVAYLFGRVSGILMSAPWLSYAHYLAKGKCSHTFTAAFWRGVGANWLGCLAAWMATRSQTVIEKTVVSYIPVMILAALGLENSISNMFTIPASLFTMGSTPYVSWRIFFINNLFPVTLGNIVGGALFVGGIYLFISKGKNRARVGI